MFTANVDNDNVVDNDDAGDDDNDDATMCFA